MNDIIEKIIKLKKEKNAVVLAHCYQNIEIDEVADFVGDSLYLSEKAKDTNADIIVFAGVSFMAETAKILSPDKKVLLPRTEAGCFMANMIDIDGLRQFKAKYKNCPVVCYVNSTAQIKAESDICCTSSNAIKVVKNLKSSEVLFVPDTYLGKWVEKQLDNVKVHTYNGFCPTHLKILPEDVENARKNYPKAKILTHPEGHQSVTALSDFTGSTKEIMDYVKNSNEKEFVIATEKGVFDRLKRDCKDKTFYMIKDDLICKNMKWNTLEDIYYSLLNETTEITLDETIMQNAKRSIERMFEKE